MKQTIPMAISIRPTTKEQLRELADKEKMPMSSYIGKLIEENYKEIIQK